MSPNDVDGMANSVDPDQTAPLGAVWSGSALFAQAYLSENLGSLVVFSQVSPISAQLIDWLGLKLVKLFWKGRKTHIKKKTWI